MSSITPPKKKKQLTLFDMPKIIINNNNKNTNNNNDLPKKKKKQLTLFDMPTININDNNEKTNNNDLPNKKKTPTIWKFRRDAVFDAISEICDDLGRENMFGMIPTIDCYSSDAFCARNITKKDNFFSSKHDDPSKWEDEVAWCNPPHIKKIMVDTINAFERRKMRGFVSVPYYSSEHALYKSQNWLFQTLRFKCKSYINIKGKGGSQIYLRRYACPFDTIVLYFDFQQ